MKNIVGQTPRGEDFFPRDNIVNRIYRRLETGSHLFLSAPRRAGKTSIMHFLEDNPQEGYLFIYLTVEDVNDTEEYFRILSDALINSPKIGNLIKAREKAKSVFTAFVENVKKIKVGIFEIETQRNDTKYSEAFEKLIRQLDTEGSKIVMMIDEFPVALEAIAKKSGVEEANRFLHINRQLRQISHNNIIFVYTGSIGLPNVTRKLNATATVNDLSIVEVPPLTLQEGQELTRQLFSTYKVPYDPSAIDYMLEKLNWLMPFFIQLVVQMLIDAYDEMGKTIDNDTVNRVLEKASNHRNNIYFESYYSRLDKTLPTEESNTAKAILAKIAQENVVPKVKFDKSWANILEILEFDGYINLDSQNLYRFNSPILQMWWRKYAQ